MHRVGSMRNGGPSSSSGGGGGPMIASPSSRSKQQQVRNTLTAHFRGPLYSNIAEGSVVIDIGTRTVKVGVIGIDVAPSIVMRTPPRLAALLLMGDTVQRAGGLIPTMEGEVDENENEENQSQNDGEGEEGGDNLGSNGKVSISGGIGSIGTVGITGGALPADVAIIGAAASSSSATTILGGTVAKIAVPATVPLPTATTKALETATRIFQLTTTGNISSSSASVSVSVDIAHMIEDEVASLLNTIAAKVNIIGTNKTPIFLKDVDCNPQLAAAVKNWLGARVDVLGGCSSSCGAVNVSSGGGGGVSATTTMVVGGSSNNNNAVGSGIAVGGGNFKRLHQIYVEGGHGYQPFSSPNSITTGGGGGGGNNGNGINNNNGSASQSANTSLSRAASMRRSVSNLRSNTTAAATSASSPSSLASPPSPSTAAAASSSSAAYQHTMAHIHHHYDTSELPIAGGTLNPTAGNCPLLTAPIGGVAYFGSNHNSNNNSSSSPAASPTVAAAASSSSSPTTAAGGGGGGAAIVPAVGIRGGNSIFAGNNPMNKFSINNYAVGIAATSGGGGSNKGDDQGTMTNSGAGNALVVGGISGGGLVTDAQHPLLPYMGSENTNNNMNSGGDAAGAPSRPSIITAADDDGDDDGSGNNQQQRHADPTMADGFNNRNTSSSTPTKTVGSSLISNSRVSQSQQRYDADFGEYQNSKNNQRQQPLAAATPPADSPHSPPLFAANNTTTPFAADLNVRKALESSITVVQSGGNNGGGAVVNNSGGRGTSHSLAPTASFSGGGGGGLLNPNSYGSLSNLHGSHSNNNSNSHHHTALPVPLTADEKKKLIPLPSPSPSVSHHYPAIVAATTAATTKKKKGKGSNDDDDNASTEVKIITTTSSNNGPLIVAPTVNSNPILSQNAFSTVANSVLTLSLQAASMNAFGLRSGIVLDLGWKSSRVVPVIHNIVDQSLASTCYWGMRAVIHLLRRQIIEGNPRERSLQGVVTVSSNSDGTVVAVPPVAASSSVEHLLTDDLLQDFILQYGVAAPPVGHPQREAILSATYPIVLKTIIVYGKPNLALEALFTGCVVLPNAVKVNNNNSNTSKANSSDDDDLNRNPNHLARKAIASVAGLVIQQLTSAAASPSSPSSANNTNNNNTEIYYNSPITSFMDTLIAANLRRSGDEVSAGPKAHLAILQHQEKILREEAEAKALEDEINKEIGGGDEGATDVTKKKRKSPPYATIAYRHGIVPAIFEALLKCHPWYNLNEAASTLILTGCLASIPNVYKRLAVILAELSTKYMLKREHLVSEFIQPIVDYTVEKKIMTTKMMSSSATATASSASSSARLPTMNKLEMLSIFIKTDASNDGLSATLQGLKTPALGMNGAFGGGGSGGGGGCCDGDSSSSSLSSSLLPSSASVSSCASAWRLALEDMYVSGIRKRMNTATATTTAGQQRQSPPSLLTSEQCLRAVTVASISALNQRLDVHEKNNNDSSSSSSSPPTLSSLEPTVGPFSNALLLATAETRIREVICKMKIIPPTVSVPQQTSSTTAQQQQKKGGGAVITPAEYPFLAAGKVLPSVAGVVGVLSVYGN